MSEEKEADETPEPSSTTSLSQSFYRRSTVTLSSAQGVISRNELERLTSETTTGTVNAGSATFSAASLTVDTIEEDETIKEKPTTSTPTIISPLPPVEHARNAGNFTILAMINRKSGGHMGQHVYDTLVQQLGKDFVTDLSQCSPEKHNMPPDILYAYALDPHVRVLACGGDGTIGWIESARDQVAQRLFQEQNEQSLPNDHLPLAILPLGTGNDASRTFGWGKKYSAKLLQDIIPHIQQASLQKLDRWRCVVIPDETVQDRDWIPHMMGSHVVQKRDQMRQSVLQSATASMPPESKRSISSVNTQQQQQNDNDPTTPSAEVLDGIFCNYFSLGLDARIAFSFHKDRSEHPEKYTSVARNKLQYAIMGITQGSKAPRLREKLSIWVSTKTSTNSWTELHIPWNCRAVALLNIPSYAGGARLTSQGAPDDGLIDVVFLTNSLRMGLISATSQFLPLVRHKVAAQATRVCIKTHQDLHFQVDGEPWVQGPSTINVRHFGKSPMLQLPKSSKSCGRLWFPFLFLAMIAWSPTCVQATVASEESKTYPYRWNPADDHPCNIPRVPLTRLQQHFPPDGKVPPLYPTPFILAANLDNQDHGIHANTTTNIHPRNHGFRQKTALDTILQHFPTNFTVTLSSSNALSEHVREITLEQYLHETLSHRETLPTVPASENWYLFGHTFSSEWQNLTQHYVLPPCRTCVRDLSALSFGIGNRGSGVQWHTHGPGFSEALHGRKHWLLYESAEANDHRPADYHKDQSSRQWMEYVYTKKDTVPRPWECTCK